MLNSSCADAVKLHPDISLCEGTTAPLVRSFLKKKMQFESVVLLKQHVVVNVELSWMAPRICASHVKVFMG